MRPRAPVALVIALACLLPCVVLAAASFVKFSLEEAFLIAIATVAWVSELVYLMLATFSDSTVFTVSLLLLFAASLWQVAALGYKRCVSDGVYPRVLFFHASEALHNRIYGMITTRATDEYDTLSKVVLIQLRRIIYGFIYCLYWLPWVVTHSMYWSLLMLAGYIMVQSNLLAHEKLQWKWHAMLLGADAGEVAAAKDHLDPQFYNQLALANSIYSLAPLLLLQTINSALMDELDSGAFCFTIVASGLALLLLLCRVVYWKSIRGCKFLEMPLLCGDIPLCTSRETPLFTIGTAVMAMLRTQSYDRLDPADLDKSRMLDFFINEAKLGARSATRLVDALDAAQIDSVAALHVIVSEEGDGAEAYLCNKFQLTAPNAKLVLRALERNSLGSGNLHEAGDVEMIQCNDSNPSSGTPHGEVSTGYPILPTVTVASATEKA